jgi:hypothetical protein
MDRNAAKTVDAKDPNKKTSKTMIDPSKVIRSKIILVREGQNVKVKR